MENKPYVLTTYCPGCKSEIWYEPQLAKWYPFKVLKKGMESWFLVAEKVECMCGHVITTGRKDMRQTI